MVVAVRLLVVLAACDTVDLGDPPPDVNACRPSQELFYTRIWPEYLGKENRGRRCSEARCHDASSPRVLVLPPPTSPGALPLPPDWAALYKAATEQLFCTNAGASPLIDKPSRTDHGGGRLIDANGEEAALVKMWVETR